MTALTQNSASKPASPFGARGPATPAPSESNAPMLLEQNLRPIMQSVATTPGLLRMALAANWALCGVTLLAAYLGIDRHRHEMQAIGRDSAPSIVAAQEIRASLADMQVEVARQLLEKPGPAQAASAAYEQRRQSAAVALVTAAENITYGDAERLPIRTLVFDAGTFEQDLARATALHDRNDPAFLAQLRDAEQVLHNQLLPAADALDKANFDALAQAYGTERSYSGLATAAFIAAVLVLLAALIATQLFLYRRMRRVFNLPLIGASLALAWLMASLVGSFLAESRELKVVKEDCFDSIHALSQARAYAYDARGLQLLGLLDPQNAGALSAGFSENAARLVSLADGQSLQSIVSAANSNGAATGFNGLLADELNNITFSGEREAALDALGGFADYLTSSKAATSLAATGDPRAVALALSDSADPSRINGCGYAFARFDSALGQTLAINQNQFDAAVERGTAALDWRLALSAAVMAAVALLTFVGLRPRMREYAS